MPNWCESDLFVEGPKEKVKEFLEFVQGDNGLLDFNKLIPYPEQFRELDRLANAWDEKPPEEKAGTERPRDGFNQGGYEWCVSHWGTKWNAARVTISEMSEWQGVAEVEIHFSTAWAPPRPVIERAAQLFPILTFDLRYFECGDGFNGMFACSGGKVDQDRSGDYFGNRGG